jgi:group I intron endonuclease
MIIYKVTNLINNKIYIGKTLKTLSKRKSCHFAHAKAGSSNYFHRAIRKYGKENFVWEVIDQCLFAESLVAMEKYYIEKFNCQKPNGYNLTAGGEGMFGYKYSEESKQKMRESHGEKQKGINHPMYGKHHSEEAKNKMRIGHIGKKQTAEHKKKKVESRKWYIHHSDETKKKIGLSNVGKHHGGKRVLET